MSSDPETSLTQNSFQRNLKYQSMLKTAAFKIEDSLHSSKSPVNRTQHQNREQWNMHFGNKATMVKQFPASTISYSIYDVTSLDESGSRQADTRDLGKRRSLLMEKMHKTGTFQNRTTIQSPQYKGDSDTRNLTAEDRGLHLSTVHDSLYSQGSVDLDGPPRTQTNAQLREIDEQSWPHFRIRRNS